MTIKKIAEIAGVSPAAVSLALNNKPGVSEETREAILEIAKKYGYEKKELTPNKNMLFIKYVGTGAAVEQNGDFIARVMDAIEQKASTLEYNLIIRNIRASEFQKEIKTISFDEYEGVVFLGTEATAEDLKLLQKFNIPIVAVDNMFSKNNVDAVVMDNMGGIYQAVKHLKELGHTRIGYIDSVIRFSNFNHRTEAYNAGIKDLGLEKDQQIITVTPSLKEAYEDVLEYLNSKSNHDLPTAFVAANDTIAIGAVKAFKEYGLNIPKDISVVGFDDIPFGSVLDKALTTIKVHKEKMGMYAVELLDKKIKNPLEPNVKMLITTELIERESTININKK